MIHIVLCCASGMSTNLLAEKMRRAAIDDDQSVTIHAISESRLNDVDFHVDVVLLGPQVRHALKRIEEKVHGAPVVEMNVRDYGMLDGKAVLFQALEAINNK